MCFYEYDPEGDTKIRYRTKLVNGELDKVVYTLEQPKMHALYRE